MKKRIIVLSVLLALFVAIGGEFMLSAFPVSAEEVGTLYYSNVYDDLLQDEAFDPEKYPVINDSYTMNVIQFAEGSEGELLVYVYQPNQNYGKYIASSINISVSLHNALSIKNYTLTLINYYGVFQKYVVDGLTVPDGNKRYYDVVSIYRRYDSAIDDKINEDYDDLVNGNISDNNGNTIDEMVYPVRKQYIFDETDGNYNVSVFDTETISITDKFVGFVRYPEGFHWLDWSYDTADSHFVAFDTDKEIDKLYEADVFYVSQGYKKVNVSGSDTFHFEERKKEYSYLNFATSISVDVGDKLVNNYTWNEIQSIDEFVDDVEFSNVYSAGIFDVSEKSVIDEEDRKFLLSKKWVLRFSVREYSNIWDGYSSTTTVGTMIGEVSILRLKFETDGDVYNLGVIDNKVTGAKDPINVINCIVKFQEEVTALMGLIIFIVILVLIGVYVPGGVTIIKFLFDLFVSLIKIIFNVVIFILSLPFRLIGWFFKA